MALSECFGCPARVRAAHILMMMVFMIFTSFILSPHTTFHVSVADAAGTEQNVLPTDGENGGTELSESEDSTPTDGDEEGTGQSVDEVSRNLRRLQQQHSDLEEDVSSGEVSLDEMMKTPLGDIVNNPEKFKQSLLKLLSPTANASEANATSKYVEGFHNLIAIVLKEAMTDHTLMSQLMATILPTPGERGQGTSF